MDDLLLNPDILEIVLSNIHEMSCVLNGSLLLALRFIAEYAVGGHIYYQTDMLFKHCSLQALDPELLSIIIDKIYNSDKDFLPQVMSKIPEHNIKMKSVDINYLKYSHIDFNLVDYYHYLYKKLGEQTDNYDPEKLGQSIIFLPGDIPQTFDEFKRIYEPLTEEFKLLSLYLKNHHHIIEPLKSMEEIDSYLLMLDPLAHNNLENYKKLLVEDFRERANINGLTMEKLETYREKYEACINVTHENNRLYTRARYICNIFIELNQYVMNHLASTNMGHLDSLKRIHEYLGLAARVTLKNQTCIYEDLDFYPFFTEFYNSGLIQNRFFPESWNYTDIQKLCFCQWCSPFTYSAQIYDGNDGNVYLLVNLKAPYTDYINFLEKKKCMYNLYISDVEYHHGRIECLEAYSHKLEVIAHKEPNHMFPEFFSYIKKKTYFVENWFSSIRAMHMNLNNAERIMEIIKKDV
jgi:hypothetical protein